MKKFIAIALMAVCSLASAKGGSEEATGRIIKFVDTPRVLIFGPERNANGADGRILVCLAQFKADWKNEGECVDANGRNAWSLAEMALPGFQLDSYEYRFPGSGGYRKLILYFKK